MDKGHLLVENDETNMEERMSRKYTTLLVLIGVMTLIISGQLIYLRLDVTRRTITIDIEAEKKWFDETANKIYDIAVERSKLANEGLDYVALSNKTSSALAELSQKSVNEIVINNHQIQKEFNAESSQKRIPLIPNIIHYIFPSKNKRPLQFTEYLSILSAYKKQNPEEIWLHCNQEPIGNWWDVLVQNISSSILRIKGLGQEIDLLNLTDSELQLEITKFQILKKYGGVYLDPDVIVVQSLDPFRVFHNVVGQETDQQISTAVLMAEANSAFIESVLKALSREAKIQIHSVGRLLYKIAFDNQKLVHIDSDTLITPTLSQKFLLFVDNMELMHWQSSYTVHLDFHRGENRIYNPQYIRPLKNVIGKILRTVYFGSDPGQDPYWMYAREVESKNGSITIKNGQLLKK